MGAAEGICAAEAAAAAVLPSPVYDTSSTYAAPTSAFELVRPWYKGVASDCPNLGCSTLTGGLPACQRKCRNEKDCNLINFCPVGADCTSGVNRCCLRNCASNNLEAVTKWGGWSVYTLDFPTSPDRSNLFK